jgi:hypothetical protein
MNPRTNQRTSFAQQLPEPGYPENIQNLYGLGMTQAVEFAKSACSTAVCMNSCLMDFYRHFFWYPMGLEYWFEAQKEAYATLMGLGTQCLCGFGPQGERELTREARRRRPASQKTRREAEEEDEGMDVAVSAFEEEILA